MSPENLTSIVDPADVLIKMGFCNDRTQAQAEIDRYLKQHPIMVISEPYAVFWRVADAASIDPEVSKVFETEYGQPYSRTALRDIVFGLDKKA